MRLAKIVLTNGATQAAVLHDQTATPLPATPQFPTLASILHADDPRAVVKKLLETAPAAVPMTAVRLLAPIDSQEVWAAGVTYKRSQVARMEESESAASHYDRVYTAARPELFFKATPHRVTGPGQPVRIRKDTVWSVPEPELTLVVSPAMKLVGYSIGNDMSARDIEGENPLYLPQAKLYDQCCGLGPCVWLPDGPLDRAGTVISLEISRGGKVVFQGQTNVEQMARGLEDLVGWLAKDNSFPNGVLLLTGTGVVPPNDFSLQPGDDVAISITGIGTLRQPVVQG